MTANPHGHFHEFRRDCCTVCGEAMTKGVLYDISDASRAKKPGLPQDSRDVSAGRVALKTFPAGMYPACDVHGALLCMNEERTIWRCPACGAGAQWYRKIMNA